jgi:hypothetical protein
MLQLKNCLLSLTKMVTGICLFFIINVLPLKHYGSFLIVYYRSLLGLHLYMCRYLSDFELLPIIGKLHPSEHYYAKQQAEYIISQVLDFNVQITLLC